MEQGSPEENETQQQQENETKPRSMSFGPSIQSNEISREELLRLAEEMFTKVGNYLQGELTITKEDYALLEAMNKVTKDKYNDMFYLAENLNTLMKSLQEKYDSFAPYLEQIDQIDENVTQLEEATRQLDDYSKRLEAKFKKILGS